MTDMKPPGANARITLRAVTRAAMGLALGAVLLTVSAPARAEDGDDNVPLDTKLFRSFMESLGLQRDGPGISYEERAPLVIPPRRDLPPPERADAAAKNPAWPVDPDVQRAKQQAAAEKKGRFANADEALRFEQRPLRPDEMTPGVKPRATRHVDDGYRAGPDASSGNMMPNQLGVNQSSFWGKVFGKDEQAVAHFTGEPGRASLTDPPPGYQTPSPAQPYGVGGKVAAPKADNYSVSHGMIEGDH
jgi:hypothetical protein